MFVFVVAIVVMVLITSLNFIILSFMDVHHSLYVNEYGIFIFYITNITLDIKILLP